MGETSPGLVLLQMLGALRHILACAFPFLYRRALPYGCGWAGGSLSHLKLHKPMQKRSMKHSGGGGPAHKSVSTLKVFPLRNFACRTFAKTSACSLFSCTFQGEPGECNCIIPAHTGNGGPVSTSLIPQVFLGLSSASAAPI